MWRVSRDAHLRNPGAPGVDGMRATMFASELMLRITKMRDEIRSGSYKFSKLRLAPIPKVSGGHRIIAIPTVRDRLLQRAMLNHLERDRRFSAESEISFGFTRGKTLANAQLQALAYRQRHPWVLQADIVSFFDRICRVDMKGLVRRNVRSKTIAELLCKAVDCELEDGGGYSAEIVCKNGIKRGVGLRQGMPVSPMLSNLLLTGFDGALVKLGFSAVRYADDIVVFANTRSECRNALSAIREELAKLGLQIPELGESKTVISDPAKPVEFLGIEIKRFGEIYKLCAPMKKIERIETDIVAAASMERCISEKRDIARLVRTLDSFILGHTAAMMVLDDPSCFLARLEAAKQKALTALLTSVVGERAVAALDDDRRAILGLQKFAA